MVTLCGMAPTRRNVKLVQLRVQRGLTQAQLAELVTQVVRAGGPRWRNATLGGEYISRLEVGRTTWPNATYRAALRTVLGVDTDAELGLYCQQVVAMREKGEAVRRRDFLATLPAVPLAEHPLRELVAAAMAERVPPPRRVGMEHAAQVRSLVRQADQLDHLYGGGLTREILAGQARWAVSLLDTHVDRAAESELFSAVGDLCIAAGFACHDGGQADSARYYLSAAVQCAEQAADWKLRARALGTMAGVAAYYASGDDALTLAQQAQVRDDRLTPLQRARLALLEAHAHGRRGDARACLAAIGRAEDEFTTTDPTNEPAWLSFFTAAELAGESANALHHLALRGQHTDAAVSRQRLAVTSYSAAHPRSRTLSAAKLVTLLLQTGERAEAVQLGHQVLDATKNLQSHRVTDSIRQLHRAASKYRGIVDIDALRQRTARALAG